MGKTETIKKRRVDVYLRSEEQKGRWNKYAKGQKMSLSKLIIDTVEARIGGDLMNQIKIKETLTDKIKKLMDENDSLKVQYNRSENYISILEREMNRSKNVSFSEPGPGIHKYHEELIRVLKDSNNPVSNNNILKQIRIDPADTEVVAGISKQLDALKSYGLIKYGSRGWIWNGQ
ncbi:MAG: hypothetical protein KAH57_08675 [Thermoplasmata archaeon]|nr:hypothetical protein [Thermoplasmata archaeon]